MRLSEVIRRLNDMAHAAQEEASLVEMDARPANNAEALRLAAEMLDAAATKALLA